MCIASSEGSAGGGTGPRWTAGLSTRLIHRGSPLSTDSGLSPSGPKTGGMLVSAGRAGRALPAARPVSLAVTGTWRG